MKFLIAALFLCIALFGQTQGGSLRGLSVAVPHQQYGVPLLSSDDRNHHQAEEIKKPNDAIIINNEEPTTSRPFIDHLPLIDSAVNFGAVPINEPITQKPELPLLQPGLPSLPSAPIIPVKIQEESAVQAEVVVPSNSYLPPAAQEVSNNDSLSKQKLPILQFIQQIQPASPIGSLPILQVIQAGGQLSNALLSPRPLFPFVQSSVIPSLPSLNPQPIQSSQHISDAYLPPRAEVIPLQPGLPSLPAAPQVPFSSPIQVQQSLPILPPGLPSLPEAPVVPVSSIAIEQPSQAQPELTNTYLPPQPELPLLQPGLPSLPAAPQVQLTIPIQAQPEQPLLPPGLPALPEAPVVPVNSIIIEQPAQVSQPELMNTYLPPKPELPLLQPGLPSLPAAPQQVPVTIPIQAQPELPLLPSGLPALPAAPVVPVKIEQPSTVVFIEEQKPTLVQIPELPSNPEVNTQIQPANVAIVEIPALPEAPVTPAPTQISEDSKIGYEYNKPAPPTVETGPIQLASQAPIWNGNNNIGTGQVSIPDQRQKPILLLNLYPDFFNNLGVFNNPGQNQPNPLLPQLPSIPNVPALQLPSVGAPISIPQLPIQGLPPIPQLPVQALLPVSQLPIQAPIQIPQLPIQAPVQIPQLPIQTPLPVPQSPLQTALPAPQLPTQAPLPVPVQLPQQQPITVQPSLPPQQVVVVESKIEEKPHNGYTYTIPSQQFLLPHQY